MKLAARILTILSLTALAGCAAIVDRRADQREAQAEAAFPPEGQFIDVGGRRVHAVVAGTGPDLVLIHGASGNTRDFTFSFVDQVSDRYRVIVFDRPGMGYTDRVDDSFAGAFNATAESPAQQAAMLQAAAAQIGVDRPIVLGHSYGGAVAMAWALNHPDNIAGLVAVAGATQPWPGSLGALYRLTASSLGGAAIPPLITAFAPPDRVQDVVASIFAPDTAPGGYGDAVGASLSVRRDSFRANARQVNGLRPHVVEMSALYPTLDLPVEIIHGDADTIVPLEIHSVPLARQVAGANLTVLEGVGHMPHHVAPQAVVAAIDRVAARAQLR
jgi:pimeloyl-ACP methyl ester carboxylesterase